MRVLHTAAARLLLGLAVASCATAGPTPDGVSGAAATAERVFAILEGRNATGTPAPSVLSARAFEQLLRALDPQNACARQRARLAPQARAFGVAVRAGDLAIVQTAALACTGARVPAQRAETIAFDAIAKAFDPHAGFVDGGHLAAEQRALHEPLPEAEQARGRIADPAGERVGWIALPSFYLQTSGRSASRDVAYLIAQLSAQGAAAIAIDLRGNRGGVIEEAARLAAVVGVWGAFAREQRAGRTIRELQAPAPQDGVVAYRGPLALLLDGDTAGVSEVFAAAIADRARGRIFGSRTHGHGSAQTMILLQSPKGAPEGALRVTDRYFVRLSGQPIEGQGVAPDRDLPASATDDALVRSIAADLRAARLPVHLP